MLNTDCIQNGVCEEKSSSARNDQVVGRAEDANGNDRICKSCNQAKPLSDYQKKGAGRYENKCKPCHNKLIKGRRQSRKPATPVAWSIKSIPHSVEFAGNPTCNFIDVLYSLLKAEGFINGPEQIQTIESLINETSNI